MTSALFLAAVGFALAYVNGANDVSKGIATLVGSGVADYRRAIVWGAIWTAAGGLVGAVLAKAMVATFGSGLLAAGTTPTLTAAMATLLGAAAWILIATRTGLPVSTTHAIVGSIAGVATVAYGFDGVRWSALVAKINVPLLVSPVASFVAVVVLLRATRWSRGTAPASAAADCLCAEVQVQPLVVAPAFAAGAAAMMQDAGQLRIVTGTTAECFVERPQALRLTVDHLHWLTSGATSFARAMNDAPKIVALVIAAAAVQGSAALVPLPVVFCLVTGGMVVGSLLAGKRVTRVLAEKVTPMDHREGFLANLITAGLVTAGATLGLPMSTTHVSSGGIVGAGTQRSSLNKKTLRDIALAWVVTLPASALLGISAYEIGRIAFG